MARVAIVGGGGFAKEVIEVAEMLGHEVVGIFARENTLSSYSHLGYLEEMREKRASYDAVHIAIGAVNARGIENRRTILDFIRKHDIPALSLVSPLATLSGGVLVGEGVYVGHEALISCDTELGEHVVVNQRAVIGHDCVIEENVSLAPLVFLGGNVRVKRDTMIGVRSTVRQGVSIGRNCVIGMGSIIVKNIRDDSLTLQMPSKIYRNRS